MDTFWFGDVFCVHFSHSLSFRRCSRQHRFWAWAGGSAYSDSRPKPATAASVRTGNIGAGKSVPVSFNTFWSWFCCTCVYRTSPIIHIFLVFVLRSSIEFVAPSQNSFTNTPFIVPSSPTGQENENSEFLELFQFLPLSSWWSSCASTGIDEPMDTSLPPEEKVREKEEPMDTETVSKPQPSASTPVSQNSPCFTLERTLSVPSQPEFSQVCTFFIFFNINYLSMMELTAWVITDNCVSNN